MAESAWDPLLASLSHEAFEMLRAFRETQSFKDVAQRFDRDERTVSRQLLDIDKAFWSTRSVHIIERPAGQKSYRLTRQGEMLVDQLEPVIQATLRAIENVGVATKRVPILCTKNCVHYFQELSETIQSADGFKLVPDPRRTAEIDLTFSTMSTQPERRISLLSALMPSEQNPSVGAITQVNDHVEVLTLEVDTPKLLTADDLGFRGPVTVREVVEAGVTFITPPVGVAWDFLNRSFPDWTRLRPFQHQHVPDLDWGLEWLAKRIDSRVAMVVHGFDLDDHKIDGLENATLHDFAVGNDAHLLLAVTGVFHVRPHISDDDLRDPYDIIWQNAQDLWREKEHEQ